MPAFKTHAITVTRLLSAATILLACSASAPRTTAAQPEPKPSAARAAQNRALYDIYKELVEINTTASAGSSTRAAEAMAARLRAAGFPEADVQVIVHPGDSRKGNLVARLRGTGAKKPLLLLAHLDVVEARREDWSADLDPFKLTEKDGFFYARGSIDDKAMAAIFVANLIQYKKEALKPSRDIILALTADEEGGDHNGAAFLLQSHRSLVDAEYGINEGGGGRYRGGRRLFHGVQASEKVFQSFLLEVKDKGGHSSIPSKDNAIYRLAAGLGRLAKLDFPVNLNEVTRAYFGRMASVESGQLAADMKTVSGAPSAEGGPAAPAVGDAIARLSASPYYNALMRTTCVATRLDAGHAENALPQTARATVNCRILPQESAEGTRRALIEALGDDKITVTPIKDPKPSPPSPLKSEMMLAIESISGALWKGVPVIPIMGTGATDSLYFRNAGIPMYGVSGLFTDIDDNRAHGKDERLGVTALYDGQEFLYRLVKILAAGK
jgi:acetylornithine deacetylase/succinyl-diaminopimelate desuccinylase-like protein